MITLIVFLTNWYFNYSDRMYWRGDISDMILKCDKWFGTKYMKIGLFELGLALVITIGLLILSLSKIDEEEASSKEEPRV